MGKGQGYPIHVLNFASDLILLPVLKWCESNRAQINRVQNNHNSRTRRRKVTRKFFICQAIGSRKISPFLQNFREFHNIVETYTQDVK